MSKIIPEQRAKQGRWGGKVLLILICALILAAIVWYGAELYGTAIDPGNTGAISTSAEG